MKKNILGVILSTSLVFGGTPAHAASFGVPDSDTAILTAMLANALKESAQLGHLVTSAQAGLQTAQQSLAIARATTDAVGSMASLASNPEEIFNGVYSGFVKSFPEIEGITNEAIALKNSYEEGIFSGDGSYDPYALQKLMHSLKKGGDSALHTIVALDASAYNLTGENLMTKKELSFLQKKKKELMEKIFMAEIAGGFTPQEAAAFSTHVELNSMRAQVETADSLNTMANMAKNEYLKAWDASTNAKGKVAASVSRLGSLIPSGADLNAFADETVSAPPPHSDSITIGGP